MDLLERLDDAAHEYLDKDREYDYATDWQRQQMRYAYINSLTNLELVRLLQDAIDKELSK